MILACAERCCAPDQKTRASEAPEGGYFKQAYRSDTIVNVEGCGGPRNIATAIYYMLISSEFSAFHRIRSDEI
jgi:hypothetical protein